MCLSAEQKINFGFKMTLLLRRHSIVFLIRSYRSQLLYYVPSFRQDTNDTVRKTPVLVEYECTFSCILNEHHQYFRTDCN